MKQNKETMNITSARSIQKSTRKNRQDQEIGKREGKQKQKIRKKKIRTEKEEDTKREEEIKRLKQKGK